MTHPMSVLVVFGSGGHTAEMLQLLKVMPEEEYSPRYYVLASSDKTSKNHAKQSGVVSSEDLFVTIPRAREVGQSYLTSIFSTIYSILWCFGTVLSLKPQLILVNGPGTCIPICVVAFILRLFCLLKCKIVFVESVCRVKSLSLSAKILYHLRIADCVQVQYEELKLIYPRTEYVGCLF